MRQIMLLLGVFSIVLITVTDIDAQRRRTRDRERDRREDTENISKIFHTIHMGNINFFSGNFSLSAKYAGGYKLHERFSAGLSGKFFFDIVNNFNGPDANLFSYGAGGFVRAKITNDIYLQGEYDITSYENFTTRDIYSYPLIGAGYEQGQGPWKFGANAMLILNEEVRDINLTGRVVEWWITFSYNF